MRITDIPEFHDKSEVLTFSPETSVLVVSKEMKEKKYGAAVIIDKDKKPVGMFTERDALFKIIADGKNPAQLNIGDVMTKNVRTATVEDDISDCMRRMSQGRFRHMPIVDENSGQLKGILSQGDFVALTWPEILKRFKEQTQSYFSNYTQIWMLVIAIMAYTVLLLAIT